MITRIFNLDEFFVSKVDEVDNIKIKCSQITINDGEKGGLINIADLVQKVNNLENKQNDILTILKTITIPLAPSGTYPFNTNFTSVQPLTPTEQGDIEDTKVKH